MEENVIGKLHCKRIISFFLVLVMVVSVIKLDLINAVSVGDKNDIVSSLKGDEKEKKEKGNAEQYLVTTKNKNGYVKVEKEFDDYVESYDGYASDNDKILKVDLTKDEASKLMKDNSIESVEKDNIVSGCAINTESKTTDTEWNMKMVRLNQISENEKKSSEKIKIAILDSGVDAYSESDIPVVNRINLIQEEKEVTTPFEDITGHGTSIAGIISAQKNKEGITGINTSAEIYSCKILDDNNTAPLSRVIEGIYWAIEKKVNIINMSFGISKRSEALEEAIKVATSKGILVVAAAGNTGKGENGESTVQYPAAYEGVLAVGAVDTNGKRLESSATGKELDIMAPGDQIKSTGAFGGEVITAGTSMAVPHVVGIASLLWQKDMNCSSEFIKYLLMKSAMKTGDNNEYGSGIIDAEYAFDNFDKIKKDYETIGNMTFTSNENSQIVTGTSIDVSPSQTTESNANNHKVKSFSNVDYVVGSWYWGDHYDNAGSVEAIKQGAKHADINDNLKKLGDHPVWHGGSSTNYIANFMYLTRVANNGANPTSGVSGANKGTIDADLSKIEFGKYNRRNFLFGMAIHSAQDVFAHSAYEYRAPCWVHLNHDSGHADDTSYPTSSRWEAAKQVTRNILARHGMKGDESNGWPCEFNAFSNYDGKFRLHALRDNAYEAGERNPDLLRLFEMNTR